MKKRKKFIHEGKYVADVEVELIESAVEWAPCRAYSPKGRNGYADRLETRAVSVLLVCNEPSVTSAAAASSPTSTKVLQAFTMKKSYDLSKSIRNPFLKGKKQLTVRFDEVTIDSQAA
jgi:hypothetical protein